MKKSLKKYFIPNEENDHKPHLLREKSVLIITEIILVLLLASILGTYAVKNTKFLASIQSAFLVDLANEDRAEEGAGKLVINDRLVAAAQLKANDMAAKSYFAHVSPEGVTPWYWFSEAKYQYIYAGENLAVNFNRSEDVQVAWMNSPLHRANILNKKYKEVGIATAEGVYKGKNTTFVVQMFGTPSSLQANLNSSQTTTTEQKPIESTDNTNPEGNPIALNNLKPEVEGESIVNLELENKEQEVKPQVSAPAPAKKPSEPVKIAQVQDQTPSPVATPTQSETENEPESIFTETTNPLYENQTNTESENITNSSEETYTNWFERLIVSPGKTVQKLYIALFAVILFSLVLKIFVSINKQHPKNIAYGVILLLLVLIFMYLNQEIFIDPVITTLS